MVAWVPIMYAAAALGSAYLASEGAKDAANTQANAIQNAGGISAAAAAKAREDALALFTPALIDFSRGVEKSTQQLLDGRITAADILRQSTSNADQILNRGSAAAQRAILGLPPVSAAELDQLAPTPRPEDRPVTPVERSPFQYNINSTFSSTESQPDTSTGYLSSGIGSNIKIDQAEVKAAIDKSDFNPYQAQWDREAAEQAGVGSNIKLNQAEVQAAIDKSDFNPYQPANSTARSLTKPASMGEVEPTMGAGGTPVFNPPRPDQQDPYVTMGPDGQPVFTPPSGATTVAGLTPDEREYLASSMGVAPNVLTLLSELPDRLDGEIFSGRKLPAIQQSIFAQTDPPLTPVSLPQPSATTQVPTMNQTGIIPAKYAIEQATGQALGQLSQPASIDLRNVYSALNQGRGAVGGSIEQGINALRQGETRGLGEIRRGTTAGVGELEQFASTGEEALSVEAALSGALGPEAEARALASFMESPGQKYLREQQEKTLLRSSAAIGGLGGGNIRTALQEQSVGIAAQQQQQRLENLRSLAGMGMSAAESQAGMQQAGGMAGGQLIGQIAGQQGQLYGTQAGLMSQLAATEAGIGGQAANLTAQLEQQRALERAGIITSAGTQQAGLSQLGGAQLADIIQGNTAAQGQLQQGLGAQLSGLDQQTTANIANLTSQAGAGQADLRASLGALLANIATGQGTQQSNMASSFGAAQAAGTLGQSAAWQQGLGNLAQAAGSYYNQPQQQPAMNLPNVPEPVQVNTLGGSYQF